jgi:transposase
MDMPVHKVAGVQEAIEAVGAELLYLPPYSPDLNPIEMAFSKFEGGIAKGSPAHNSRPRAQDSAHRQVL